MVIAGFIPLIVLGLLLWLVVSALKNRGPHVADTDEPGEIDMAASIRRLVLYGLTFLSLVLLSSGLASALGQLIEGETLASDRAEAVAQSLAFIIVGAPAFVLLGRYGMKQLDTHPVERRSASWSAYLNLSLAVSLAVSMFQAHKFLRAWANDDSFDRGALVAVIIWSAVWAGHWLWLLPRYGINGDLHLAAGSVAGLVVTLIASVGLFQQAGDNVLDRLMTVTLSEGPDVDDGPTTWTWVITFVLGAGVWAFFWLARYRRSPQTDLWSVVVLFPGTLLGLIMTVVSAAGGLYLVLVWFVGEPAEDAARSHFDGVPILVGALLVGAGSWWHHQLVLDERSAQHPEVRSDPVRVRDYVLSGASLITAMAGATMLLVGLLEALSVRVVSGDVSVVNRVILAVILLVIGGPLWWWAWSRLEARVREETDRSASELRSPIRRIYLIGLFGVGGLVVIVSLIGAITSTLRDLIEGIIGRSTLDENRFGIALIATVTGVAWYHFNVFRRDRHAIDALLPPPPVVTHQRTGWLVTPAGSPLAGGLPGRLTRLIRTDLTDVAAVDPAEVQARIDACASDQVLVVQGRDGVDVVPIMIPGDRS